MRGETSAEYHSAVGAWLVVSRCLSLQSPVWQYGPIAVEPVLLL